MNVDGDSVNLAIQVNDPDTTDILTFGASGLPTGLSIDSSSGVISGTINVANTTTFNANVTVDDGNGGADNVSFSWDVQASGGGGGNTFQPDGNDLLSIEAESFTNQGPNSGRTWQSQSNPNAGFSGTGTLITLPDARLSITTNYAATSPRLDAQIQINTPGTYKVWVRGRGPGGGSNSVHVGVNNAEVGSAANIGFAAGNAYAWSDGADTLTFSQAGPYTLNVWMREDGSVFDKIEIVLNTTSYTPSGTGSPESQN